MSMRPGTDRELSPRKMPDGLGRRVNRSKQSVSSVRLKRPSIAAGIAVFIFKPV